MTELNRRTLIAGAVALAASGPHPGHAAAPPTGTQSPGVYRFRVGSFEITAINDGVWDRAIDAAFVRNAPYPEVRAAMRDAFMPAPDKVPLPVTALVVNTGPRLVLLDTGTGGQIAPTAGLLAANLRAAGIDPAAIDLVAISHFHPDHINGLKTKDDARVFPNAEIAVPAPEWAFFMDDANLRAAPDARRIDFLNARRIFRDLDGALRRFEPGTEIVPGIMSLPAFGHTPGHTVFTVDSGAEQLIVLGDTADHPGLFVRFPLWQPANDMDGPAAALTRVRLLDRIAADRLQMQGTHFPFPSIGHIVREGSGFRFAPSQWQPQL